MPDYAALAAEHGGVPDYAALAAEHGGTVDTPTADFKSTNEKDASGNAVVLPDWSQRLGLHEPTDSRVLGFLRGAGTAAVDLAEGAAAGINSTVLHGGDLIRRATGMERIIDTPAAKQAMHAPENLQGTIGKGVEQAAEFAGPLAAVSKGVGGLSLAARLAAEGAAGAGVAGVQSGGDPATMAVGAALPAAFAAGSGIVKGAAGMASRAAAGASEGGVGGAIANAVMSVAKPESKAMLVQALKPRNTRLNFGSALDRALPEIKAVEQETGQPIKNIDQLIEATKAAKARVWQQWEQLAGPKRAMGMTVDTSPVADAIEASIPRRVQIQNPEQAKRIKALADTYRTRMGVDDVQQMLSETNDSLESYYNKFPQSRAKALNANPEIAHEVAEAENLRKVLYNALDSDADGAAAREVKRRYGALMEVEDAAMRRSNVAARQQPESLSEQIGKVRAAADMARGVWRASHGDLAGLGDIAAARAGSATATYLKEQQSTNNLILRALRAHTALPTPIEMPKAPNIAGYLPPASVRMGPGADPSFVRGVPAQPAMPERLGLPAPARQMPPAPDASFVRGVPAEVARPERLGLPAKSQGPEIPSGAPIQIDARPKPDTSGVKSVKAAPVAYDYMPTRGKMGRPSQRLVPSQYSGDPGAAPAPKSIPIDTKAKSALQWIRQDMDAIPYQEGGTVNRASANAGTDNDWMHGDMRASSRVNTSGGAPIYRAIVGESGSASRGDVIKAIDELLTGSGKRSPLKDSIVEVAEGLKRGMNSVKRLMMTPPGHVGR